MATTAPERQATAPIRRRAVFSQRARHALLTAHIVVYVGLLGDAAGYLAGAIARRRWTTRAWFAIPCGRSTCSACCSGSP